MPQASRSLPQHLEPAPQPQALLCAAPALLCERIAAERGQAVAPHLHGQLAQLLLARCGPPAGGIAKPSSGDLPPFQLPAMGRTGSSGEALLDVLARLQPGAGRRGQVFTPWALAQQVVALLEPRASQRWLDPAAGAGIFLQAATEAGVPMEHCKAMEVDALALTVGQALLPECDWKLGDALAAWEDLPAGWRQGFDRVVLNPPYRNGVEGREASWVAWREDLRSRFSCACGPFDLYVPFIQRGLELLAPGGRLGLLVPMAWLASGSGRALRRLLSEGFVLRRLQHAPGVRLFPRADLDALFLVVEAPRVSKAKAPDLVVESLDKHLRPLTEHQWGQAKVKALAEAGWGPLLWPPHSLRRPAAACLGQRHQIAASLSAAEFYTLPVAENAQPALAEIRLLSSGAIEPFHSTWGQRSVRFRHANFAHPVVRLDDLPCGRQQQVQRPRVLIANLSRRLEALAVDAGHALGVVNVIQLFCRDLHEAQALAAWLNSAPLQAWTRLWHDPLRLHTQLALSRGLVGSLPAPPAEGPQASRLAQLGADLAELWQRGEGKSARAQQLQLELDHLAEAVLPPFER